MGQHKQHLCPCGSRKHKKACCQQLPRGTKVELEETARRLSKAGRHLEACEVLEQRAALSPDNPMIWNELGNEYAAAGQLENALAALKRGHEGCPDYPLPLYNLGKHLLDRCLELRSAGSADELQIHAMAADAIKYFKASLERDSENAACHHNLAIAYRVVEDLPGASAHMIESLRLDPATKGSS